MRKPNQFALDNVPKKKERIPDKEIQRKLGRQLIDASRKQLRTSQRGGRGR